jgi:microcystin-dependent protein
LEYDDINNNAKTLGGNLMNNRKNKGFIGIEVAIVASIVLLTGFAALNTFNARALNSKDQLIGQFQNTQLNLNGTGSQLTDDQINQLKSTVLESIDVQAIKTSVLSLINIAQMKDELLAQINVPLITSDIISSINVPQIKADIMATVNVPQIKEDVIAFVNVPQIKIDLLASIPTDADTLDGKHASQLMTDFVNKVWPVGAVYTSFDAANPGTTIGGTWIAVSQGRVLVGAGTSDQAFVAGTTGGASTHTLTIAQMPSHTHLQQEHNHTQNPHSHPQHDATWMNVGPKVRMPGSGVSGSLYASALGLEVPAGASTKDTTATNNPAKAVNDYTGSGTAHNNLQPYLVVFMWRRTA